MKIYYLFVITTVLIIIAGCSDSKPNSSYVIDKDIGDFKYIETIQAYENGKLKEDAGLMITKNPPKNAFIVTYVNKDSEISKIDKNANITMTVLVIEYASKTDLQKSSDQYKDNYANGKITIATVGEDIIYVQDANLDFGVENVYWTSNNTSITISGVVIKSDLSEGTKNELTSTSPFIKAYLKKYPSDVQKSFFG